MENNKMAWIQYTFQVGDYYIYISITFMARYKHIITI